MEKIVWVTHPLVPAILWAFYMYYDSVGIILGFIKISIALACLKQIICYKEWQEQKLFICFAVFFGVMFILMHMAPP